MILGHFGLALAAKRVAPTASTGTTTLAAQLVDLVWPILLLVGIEQVRIVPGYMAASAFDFVHYPWTHSLVMGLVWGVALGGLYYAARRNARAALIVGALVPSHFVLDLLVHGPDLPLWPGGPLVGFGAWNSIPLTLLLELAIFTASIVVYVRTTKPRDRIGRFAFIGYVVALLVLYVSSLILPPPPSFRAAAGGALAMWLFIPWAAWFDRHRILRT
jgi:hypothetical protein